METKSSADQAGKLSKKIYGEFMSIFVILVRHPNGAVFPITNDDDSIKEYQSIDDAESALSDLLFCRAYESEAIEINI